MVTADFGQTLVEQLDLIKDRLLAAHVRTLRFALQQHEPLELSQLRAANTHLKTENALLQETVMDLTTDMRALVEGLDAAAQLKIPALMNAEDHIKRGIAGGDIQVRSTTESEEIENAELEAIAGETGKAQTSIQIQSRPAKTLPAEGSTDQAVKTADDHIERGTAGGDVQVGSTTEIEEIENAEPEAIARETGIAQTSIQIQNRPAKTSPAEGSTDQADKKTEDHIERGTAGGAVEVRTTTEIEEIWKAEPEAIAGETGIAQTGEQIETKPAKTSPAEGSTDQADKKAEDHIERGTAGGAVEVRSTTEIEEIGKAEPEAISGETGMAQTGEQIESKPAKTPSVEESTDKELGKELEEERVRNDIEIVNAGIKDCTAPNKAMRLTVPEEAAQDEAEELHQVQKSERQGSSSLLDAALDHATNMVPCMPDLHYDLGERLWIVVAGAGTQGLLVRKDSDLRSLAYGVKLRIGTKVQQLEIRGKRLKYRRIRGEGPDIGWVSMESATGRKLLLPLPVDDEEAVAAAALAAVVTG